MLGSRSRSRLLADALPMEGDLEWRPLTGLFSGSFFSLDDAALCSLHNRRHDEPPLKDHSSEW